MKALVLEDVARFEVRDIPSPALGAGDVLIRVGAVGLCGTDLHIFHGFANYHRDQNGQPIPLRQAPQILGHEFCGTVEVVGSDVRKCKPGDKVVADSPRAGSLEINFEMVPGSASESVTVQGRSTAVRYRIFHGGHGGGTPEGE